MQLDIGWRDLLVAIGYCCMPYAHDKAARDAEIPWRNLDQDDETLVALSVRSAFDLALRACEFPPGSEILFSAINVPDMPRIAELHGLHAVPIELNDRNEIDLDSLTEAITPRTRAIVVAHLFGATQDLNPIADIARRHQLLLIEDSAQCFRAAGEMGHASSDLVLHSFGPIKTCTALGGGTVRVRDKSLRKKMRAIQSSDPLQSRFKFLSRVMRFSLMKLLSQPMIFGVFYRVLRSLRVDVDSLVTSLARGFRSDHLLRQLRKQPSTPLLRLLNRRWRSYDERRLQRRVAIGRRYDETTRQSREASDTYWAYPIHSQEAQLIRDRLIAVGVDATCQSRLVIIRSKNGKPPPQTARRWRDVVFVPCYPELDEATTDRIVNVLREYPQTFAEENRRPMPPAQRVTG